MAAGRAVARRKAIRGQLGPHGGGDTLGHGGSVLGGVGLTRDTEFPPDLESDPQESDLPSVSEIHSSVASEILAAPNVNFNTPTKRTPADMALGTPLTDNDMAWFLFYLENGARPSEASNRVHCSWAQMRRYIHTHSYFKKRFEDAFQSGLDCLEDEIRRRGFDGFESKEETISESINRGGEVTPLKTVKVKLNYDATLALAYLKRNRVEWRDHTTQDINANVSAVSKLSDNELDEAIEKKLREMKNGEN